VTRHVVETTYGHDSFLLEDIEQTAIIAEFLARVYQPERARRHP
jgi:homoserine acetyltransferase